MEAYLDSEQPERSALVGVERAIFTDGTDTRVDHKRNDPSADAILNKTQCSRSVQWCSAGCIPFEHTKEFGSHPSEIAIL